jgi:hypothetical protein
MSDFADLRPWGWNDHCTGAAEQILVFRAARWGS